NLCRALPEKESEGQVVRWLGTFTDVDAQRRAHDESRAAIRVRDEFLSVASHELRTPLTALRLQLQAAVRRLERGPSGADAQFQAKLDAALKQTDRLAGLVDGLLDVSRVATSRLQLRPEEVDLSALVREVAHHFEDEAARAGCELRLFLPEKVVGRW